MYPLVFGDYPEEVKATVAKRSTEQSYTRSRLPAFTEEEIEFTKGTLDFIGLNHYTSKSAAHEDTPKMTGGYHEDMEVRTAIMDNDQVNALSMIVTE